MGVSGSTATDGLTTKEIADLIGNIAPPYASYENGILLTGYTGAYLRANSTEADEILDNMGISLAAHRKMVIFTLKRHLSAAGGVHLGAIAGGCSAEPGRISSSKKRKSNAHEMQPAAAGSLVSQKPTATMISFFGAPKSGPSSCIVEPVRGRTLADKIKVKSVEAHLLLGTPTKNPLVRLLSFTMNNAG